MIKLVGIDLDGTLLDSKKCVSDENARAIAQMEKNGVIVTFFTGRTWTSAREYLHFISNDVAAVFQNGAYIVTAKSKNVLKKVTLPKDKAKELIIKAQEKGFFSLVTTNFSRIPDMVYEGPLPDSSNFSEYLRRNLYRMSKVKNIQTCVSEETSGIVWIGPLNEILDASSELELSGVTMVVDTVVNGEAFVEFFGEGCGKEKAMEFLLEYYGVSKTEAAFVGDSYNDLNALKMVHGVVMGNAPDELKDIADFVTLSNNDNGFSYAVENFILKENDPVG